MARIYKTTDKIKYKIGEVEVKISPLDLNSKAVLQELGVKGLNGDTKALLDGAAFAIKSAVKEVTGIEDAEGNPYKLEFDDQGKLTDDCVQDLMNLQESSGLSALCGQLLAGVPSVLPKGVTLVKEDKGPEVPLEQQG